MARPGSLRYADKELLTPDELTSFTARGGSFRSRPGAPKADATAGRRSDNPAATAAANAAWGATFNDNSVYGSRPDAGSPAIGTSANPIAISPIERASIAARNNGIAQTNQPFMPTPTMLRLPDMKLSPTDASGDAAALARNVAMTQPGGLAQYQAPTPTAPDALHQRVIDDATAYHKANGIPLPAPAVNPPAGVNQNVTNDILRKYQTRGTAASTSYGSRLAALNL